MGAPSCPRRAPPRTVHVLCGHQHGKLSSPTILLWTLGWSPCLQYGLTGGCRSYPLETPHSHPVPFSGLTRGHADLWEGDPQVRLSTPGRTAALPICLLPSVIRAEVCSVLPAGLSRCVAPLPLPHPRSAWREHGGTQAFSHLNPEVLLGTSLYLPLVRPGHVVARSCKGGWETFLPAAALRESRVLAGPPAVCGSAKAQASVSAFCAHFMVRGRI